MTKNIIFLFITFYILVLLQTSFLIHFSIQGIVPNLILAAVILINLIEKTEQKSGIASAIIGGFFLDIFSSRPFGLDVLILLTTAIFIKIILRKYVRIPVFKGV